MLLFGSSNRVWFSRAAWKTRDGSAAIEPTASTWRLSPLDPRAQPRFSETGWRATGGLLQEKHILSRAWAHPIGRALANVSRALLGCGRAHGQTESTRPKHKDTTAQPRHGRDSPSVCWPNSAVEEQARPKAPPGHSRLTHTCISRVSQPHLDGTTVNTGGPSRCLALLRFPALLFCFNRQRRD